MIPRWESGPGGLPFLLVDTAVCQARVTSHGAHVCEWTPAGQPVPALFLGPRSQFARGKAIRGGVPVCFPWFAAHRSGDPAKPAHGFARTRAWDVVRVEHDANGVVAEFALGSDADTRRHWEAEFVARLTVTLGLSLGMALTVENRGSAGLAYEAALHSYFVVGDVERVTVHGLDGARFVDKVDGFREKTQAGPLAIRGEVDRVFLGTEAACEVEDPVVGRRIRIDKRGSHATVVWNPGPVKGPAIADLGGEAWRGFVCVETANCGIHEIRLAPGARHTMEARVSVA